jgi:hypothetical protein
MRLIARVLPGFLPLVFIAFLARPAAAQRPVTSADVQQLQDSIADTARDVSQVQSRDGALAKDLESELDNARDDATYLKVKLRRNEPIARSEYTDLRDRITSIRDRARGENTSPSKPSPDHAPDPVDRDAPAPSGPSRDAHEIPVGTEFDVRLQQALSSDTAQPEDRFEATTMVDLLQGDRVLVPAGSTLRGVVSSVTKATRIERKGALTVTFDRITVTGRAYPIRATVTQALESEGIKGEKEKIGAGAGVGAIIGGILGGFKGALAGILIGGGGTIAATEGKDVDLAPGTVLRVRLDTALIVR